MKNTIDELTQHINLLDELLTDSLEDKKTAYIFNSLMDKVKTSIEQLNEYTSQYEDNSNTFANRLRQAMTNRGYKYAVDLAKRINVSSSTISRYLRGESVPSPDMQEKLFNMLGEFYHD